MFLTCFFFDKEIEIRFHPCGTTSWHQTPSLWRKFSPVKKKKMKNIFSCTKQNTSYFPKNIFTQKCSYFKYNVGVKIKMWNYQIDELLLAFSEGVVTRTSRALAAKILKKQKKNMSKQFIQCKITSQLFFVVAKTKTAFFLELKQKHRETKCQYSVCI